jgi:hypothetical protein
MFTQYFCIIVNNVQQSVINLVETLLNNNVKVKKKVRFSEINIQESLVKKKQKHIKQSIKKPKIIIQESNDDFDFFVYFE